MRMNLKVVAIALVALAIPAIYFGWRWVLGILLALGAIVFIGPILFGLVAKKNGSKTKDYNGHVYLPEGIGLPLALMSIVVILLGYLALELMGGGLWPLFAVIGLFAGYVLSGIKTIQQDRVAAYLVFGKATKDLEPGLVIAPPFVANVEQFTSATIHLIIGVRTDKEGKIIPNEPVGDETIVSDNRQRLVNFAGKDTALDKVPDKIKYDHTGTIVWTQGAPARKYEDDALQKPLTSSPIVAVLIRISSPKKFIRAAGSLQNAFGNIARLTEGTLNQFAGKNTLRFCILNAEDVTEAIQRRVEWLVGDPDAIKRIMDGSTTVSQDDQWGIDIENVQILYWGQSYPLNQAMEKVAIAQLAKQATIEEKIGESKGIKLVGKANAEAATSMHESESEELAYKLSVLKAMVETAKGSKLIIASGTEGVEQMITKGYAVGQTTQKMLDSAEKPAGKTNPPAKGGKT